MAKQGQHQGDRTDPTKSKGHNNPKESMTITAGSPKKKETYDAQARAGENVNRQAQEQKNEWTKDFRRPPDEVRTRATAPTSSQRGTKADASRSGRSGSRSNPDAGTRGHS